MHLAKTATRARRTEVQKDFVAKAKAKLGQTVLSTAAAGIAVYLVTGNLTVLGSEQGAASTTKTKGARTKETKAMARGSGPRAKVKASTKSRGTAALTVWPAAAGGARTPGETTE